MTNCSEEFPFDTTDALLVSFFLVQNKDHVNRSPKSTKTALQFRVDFINNMLKDCIDYKHGYKFTSNQNK